MMPTIKKFLGILMRVVPKMIGMWDNKLREETHSESEWQRPIGWGLDGTTGGRRTKLIDTSPIHPELVLPSLLQSPQGITLQLLHSFKADSCQRSSGEFPVLQSQMSCITGPSCSKLLGLSSYWFFWLSGLQTAIVRLWDQLLIVEMHLINLLFIITYIYILLVLFL